jgi:hypothetical protein
MASVDTRAIEGEIDRIRSLGLEDLRRKLGSPEEVQVVLRARKQGAGALLGRLKAATKSLLRRPDLRTEASHFVIKGLMQDSGRVEPLDLLRDQLISHKRIIRVNERSRALDKDAAYAAITQAFEEVVTFVGFTCISARTVVAAYAVVWGL